MAFLRFLIKGRYFVNGVHREKISYCHVTFKLIGKNCLASQCIHIIRYYIIANFFMSHHGLIDLIVSIYASFCPPDA